MRTAKKVLLAKMEDEAAHIAGLQDTHPDELPPDPEGSSPFHPCEPMGATTIRSYFLALSTLSATSSVTVLDPHHQMLE